MKKLGFVLLALALALVDLPNGRPTTTASAATLDSNKFFCDLHPLERHCKPWRCIEHPRQWGCNSGDPVVRDHRHEHPPKTCTGDRKGPNGVIIHCN